MKNKCLLLFFPIAALAFSSCTDSNVVPYVITEPICTFSHIENVHLYGGIHFTFYNNSNKDIDSLTFKCIVFNEEGQNPFVGSNNIIAKYNNPVYANDYKEIIISLDSYIYQIPKENLIIDYAYVSKIQYSDGSVWKDVNGIFTFGG